MSKDIVVSLCRLVPPSMWRWKIARADNPAESLNSGIAASEAMAYYDAGKASMEVFQVNGFGSVGFER